MFLRLDSTPTVSSRIIDTWTVLGKEDVDHNNCHHVSYKLGDIDISIE